MIKIKEFKEIPYENRYIDREYKDLSEWQKENSNIKILDTKIQQKVFTTYENYLLITYEEDEQQKDKETSE